MTQAAMHVFKVVGQAVEEEMEEHVQKYHVPRPKRGPLQAIPFPDWDLDDAQVAKAWEWLQLGTHDLAGAAEALGAPECVLERHLAEYFPRWRAFLTRRMSGVSES